MTDQDFARDQLRIQRVLFDYAWACDNGEWERLRSLFTDQAHLDYSSTGGPKGGPDAIVGWLSESLGQIEFIQHVVSNFQIDLSGDRATGRAMFYTVFRLPGHAGVLSTGGYYTLELIAGPDGWLLEQLVEDNRWMTGGAGAIPGP